MKTHLIAILVLFAQVILAQEMADLAPKPLFKDDPKGMRLPAAVPRMVDANGNVVWIDHSFTTRQYQGAAYNLVLAEANQVAKELRLPGEYPIAESNLVEAIITPFGFNYANKTIGSVTTKHYCYYVSQDNKFSYLEGTHQTEVCLKFEKGYTWPISRMDTNQAYKAAVHFLSTASMDVRSMKRDCNISIRPDDIYVHPAPGEFVPIYWVTWTRKGYVPDGDVGNAISNDVASVFVFVPTKTLLALRVENAKYILRKPLLFTNLDSLLPGKAPVIKLPPPQFVPAPGPG